MKKGSLLVIIIHCIFISSCEKNNVNYKLDNSILAGQKSGLGIHYFDLNPDINCMIIAPWEDTDTIIHLDLDKNGIYDFTIKGTMCHPSMLGADCENLSISPLFDNEICINQNTNWLDTIPYLDTICMESNWSNDEALIYSYYWDIDENTSTEGHWQDVSTSDEYYIGYRIKKEAKSFYGWIGMKRDTTTWGFSFHLTDYAILIKYQER